MKIQNQPALRTQHSALRTTDPANLMRAFFDDLDALIDRYRVAARNASVMIPSLDRTGYTDTFSSIVETIANQYNIDPRFIDQSRQKCRVQSICEIRFLAFHFCSLFTGARQMDIARHFHADRASVTLGLRRCQDLIDTDPGYREIVSKFEFHLRETLKIQQSANPVAAMEALTKSKRAAAFKVPFPTAVPSASFAVKNSQCR